MVHNVHALHGYMVFFKTEDNILINKKLATFLAGIAIQVECSSCTIVWQLPKHHQPSQGLNNQQPQHSAVTIAMTKHMSYHDH